MTSPYLTRIKRRIAAEKKADRLFAIGDFAAFKQAYNSLKTIENSNWNYLSKNTLKD